MTIDVFSPNALATQIRKAREQQSELAANRLNPGAARLLGVVTLLAEVLRELDVKELDDMHPSERALVDALWDTDLDNLDLVIALARMEMSQLAPAVMAGATLGT